MARGSESADPPEDIPTAELLIHSWAAPFAELVTGAHRRPMTSSPAVVANARLTAKTGIALVVVLAVEGATLLSIRRLLPVHYFVGLMLIPPVVLKLASTGRRFAGYYVGDPRFREAGPPPLVLRLVGPLVVLSTIAVLGTGMELWLFGTRLGTAWITAHKATFVLWLGLTAIHVVGHLERAPTLVLQDARDRPPISGRSRRTAWVVASLLLGAALAVSTLLWQSPFAFPIDR